MKIENYQFPKSSFLSVEKDYSIIIQHMIANERLQKLLYYNTKDALQRDKVPNEGIQELLEKNIRIVPKIHINNEVATYIVVTLDDFSPSDNPEYRDNIIVFDIICNLEQWALKDFQLRPLKIAGELDFMFNNKKLTGIGTLEFVSANQMILNADYAVLTLIYRTYHGEEDKTIMLNPIENQKFIQYFDEAYNQD